jgi:hypothetical protein
MNTKVPKTWLAALFAVFAATSFITVTGWLFASPTDDINQAVTASGQKNVHSADGDQFIAAFSAVLVGVDEEESGSYVAAAKKLRPDLSAKITAAAAEVDRGPKDASTDDAERVTLHRHRVHICCRHHQFALPPRLARLFLKTHPNCSRGPCNAYSTPPPHA